MTVLSSEQRKLLSDVVVRAREVVEAACAQRITALGVAADKAPVVLTDEERSIRVGLRARARQLGSVDALVTEAGFEHWHRMLFARFLADNQLLVDDEFSQPLSMDEVAEYAAETGETDQWEVAARFASAMLPGIFSQDDPILAVRLPVETRQELERLLNQLPAGIITAEDSLGWVYQYWQASKKKEVNESERKIGGADLAPVTQLFTENYMVRFLLENSLGAWWASRHPDSPLLAGWEYLRRNEDGSPAVVGFDGWPDAAADLTMMDPCCGSGHFLTAAFGMLWRMRAEEEHLDPAEAQDAALRDNIFGLELDPRCTQIAAFALGLEAWKSGGYRDIPLPNIACSGIPARAPLADWVDLAGGDSLVEGALTRLHELFANADTLGSLIDPIRAAEEAGLVSADWADVAPLVQQALNSETSSHSTDPAATVFGQAATGIVRAADYLSRHYTLVATNPPYLGQGRQSPELASHLVHLFGLAKGDLATAMLARWLCWGDHRTLVVVSPQTWLFLKTYRQFRRELMEAKSLTVVARLGPGAFDAISGEVVQSALMIIGATVSGDAEVFFLDLSGLPGPEAKASGLLEGVFKTSLQAQVRTSPNSVIAPVMPTNATMLADVADAHYGSKPGQTSRVKRSYWEIPNLCHPWVPLESGPNGIDLYSGKSQCILTPQEAWDRGVPEFGIRGSAAWGQVGAIVSRMAQLQAGIYCGNVFDDNSYALIPRVASDLDSLIAFVTSPEYLAEVRARNQKLGVDTDSMVNVPFDAAHWRSIAKERFADGLPEPLSDDPTQWIFRGAVVDSRSPLQVGVARLLGFQWPDQEPDTIDALVDDDGVVCLPALGGESTAEERLRRLLAVAYGGSWSPQALDTLLSRAGAKPGLGGLEKWLRDGFFKDHCKLFANRPFVWQIWDGHPDGFSALVNYHRLDRKLLERLTYDYLGGWWIGRLNDEVRQQVPGAETRLVAAEELKDKLKLILEGEPPYDIYVRWKSLSEQPMGWEPDLDDGVRLNIRPFMAAGVLRSKPNIKWSKDRGKNPDGSERHNDLHFTLAEKRVARGGAGQ